MCNGDFKAKVIGIVSTLGSTFFEKSGMGVKWKWYGVNISGKVVSGIGIIFFWKRGTCGKTKVV